MLLLNNILYAVIIVIEWAREKSMLKTIEVVSPFIVEKPRTISEEAQYFRIDLDCTHQNSISMKGRNRININWHRLTVFGLIRTADTNKSLIGY